MRLDQISDNLNEAAMRATFYHGTSLKKAVSILQKGLLPHGSNSGYFDRRGVFFTPDIETAARYAIGDFVTQTIAPDKEQVILEFDISKAKRLKRIDHDPKDRPEEYGDCGDEYSPEEGIETLEKSMQKVIAIFTDNYTSIKFQIPQEGIYEKGLSHFNGYNIYKNILDFLGKRMSPTIFKQRRGEIVKAMHKEFQDDTFGDYISVTTAGTIRILPDYYETKDQFVYPNVIPPSAIKAIWVKQDAFPSFSGKEIKEFGARRLVGEEDEDKEDLKSAYRSIERIDDDLDSFSRDPMKYYARLASRIDDAVYEVEHIDDFDEDLKFLLKKLKSLSDSLEDQEEISEESKQEIIKLVKKAVEECNDIRNNEDPADLYDRPIIARTKWIRVPVTDQADIAKIKSKA